jgi:hypothetical protein
MFFDNLAVFVVPLVCTLLFSLLSVHSFPLVPSSSSLRRVLTNVERQSDDLSSSEENDIAVPIGDFFSFDKRSLSPPMTNPFHLISAMADPDLQQFGDSPPISQSLKQSVEGNPLMRAWLGILLQKLMEEQPQPYIFKYGRRRK